MTRTVFALGIAMLLAFAVAAYADPPTIAGPQEGAEVGPSVTVEGTAPGANQINVWTEVHNADTDQLLKSVPGLKHAIGDDGKFNVRIATPRIYFGAEIKLRYEIHAQSSHGTDVIGEAKVVVQPQPQAQTTDTAPATGEAPLVTAPAADAEVGPSVDVVGRAQPGALVVIWTEVYNADTNDSLRQVPGIRHTANADGNFNFRIAVPRVFVGENASLRYEIHVKAAVNQQYTPETIIVVHHHEG
jgi:hypothetical protein